MRRLKQLFWAVFWILAIASVIVGCQVSAQYFDFRSQDGRKVAVTDNAFSVEYYQDAAKKVCGYNPQTYSPNDGLIKSQMIWSQYEMKASRTENGMQYADYYSANVWLNGYTYPVNIEATADGPIVTSLTETRLNSDKLNALLTQAALKQLYKPLHYIEVIGSPDANSEFSTAKVYCNSVYSNDTFDNQFIKNRLAEFE
ncbi:MAG: hypothetical protein GW762_05245 [Candidatus Pacebacteria bacterium]|nr:hypothetical protein [Candidatus Paceibacterota bacterium]PIR63848.1 MAG: hypothetical protein COU64_02660 [Candidatus Pacebacteria bacterium CG10_big_fil_rev_8_21_14_0_10_40_26]PIZ78376.1 MAG: hypothetical protein COY01_06370 [Candidatus Pacebacteria bacterium CG_4_10_14_0_2_um_filter_40_20]PJA68580.1 MAG: hypothetical protein CO156_03675 [Candidatus Pacebacteria bacterium CG_4_9_14_3_um_filter_40_12]PJC41520.1 MAG: hypothetical protein CO041_02265 [Candidatus Pacebacteria bacterium CG_4_9_